MCSRIIPYIFVPLCPCELITFTSHIAFKNIMTASAAASAAAARHINALCMQKCMSMAGVRTTTTGMVIATRWKTDSDRVKIYDFIDYQEPCFVTNVKPPPEEALSISDALRFLRAYSYIPPHQHDVLQIQFNLPTKITSVTTKKEIPHAELTVMQKRSVQKSNKPLMRSIVKKSRNPVFSTQGVFLTPHQFIEPRDVLVITTKEEVLKEAIEHGAAFVGDIKTAITHIQAAGKMKFGKVLCTPDVAKTLRGKHIKTFGKLLPTASKGLVHEDILPQIPLRKYGVEYSSSTVGWIHAAIGFLDWDAEKVLDNVAGFVKHVISTSELTNEKLDIIRLTTYHGPSALINVKEILDHQVPTTTPHELTN